MLSSAVDRDCDRASLVATHRESFVAIGMASMVNYLDDAVVAPYEPPGPTLAGQWMGSVRKSLVGAQSPHPSARPTGRHLYFFGDNRSSGLDLNLGFRGA